MTAPGNWASCKAGDDCPLCAPRPDETDGMALIRRLQVSSLYLNKSQTYRGACILVYDTAHRTRIDELSSGEWQALSSDLYRAQSAIVRVVTPDHVNTESLGNVVPHLHFHIVPRYANDVRWGDPIWMSDVSAMPQERLADTDFEALRRALAAAIEAG